MTKLSCPELCCLLYYSVGYTFENLGDNLPDVRNSVHYSLLTLLPSPLKTASQPVYLRRLPYWGPVAPLHVCQCWQGFLSSLRGGNSLCWCPLPCTHPCVAQRWGGVSWPTHSLLGQAGTKPVLAEVFSTVSEAKAKRSILQIDFKWPINKTNQFNSALSCHWSGILADLLETRILSNEFYRTLKKCTVLGNYHHSLHSN